MIIGITGHTRGLGKFLHTELSKTSTCFGFSKSTGFDITKKECRQKIIEAVKDANVFINCAQEGFAQIDLLYEMYDVVKEKKVLIINIGSNLMDFKNRNKVEPYSIEKDALNSASKQLGRLNNECKVSIINLGHIGNQDGFIPYEDVLYFINILIETFNKQHKLLEIHLSHA